MYELGFSEAPRLSQRAVWSISRSELKYVVTVLQRAWYPPYTTLTHPPPFERGFGADVARSGIFARGGSASPPPLGWPRVARQIAQVLQFVDKASPMAEELPMLVARMYSLKGIHEEV